jgi:hypothetical protein
MADRLRIDKHTVKARLRESLYRYAELAGWVDHKAPLLRSVEIEKAA